MFNKCPKCDKTAVQFQFEPAPAKSTRAGGITLNCIAFLCPHCKTTLGVQVDPLAVMTDTVKKIAATTRR